MSKLPATFGDLKKAGYTYKSIHQEIRENLLRSMKDGTEVFSGVIGYEDTVLPQVKRALLAGHNMNLLGLRGQAKTMIARKMVNLLDEYIPVVEGSELMDDPFRPLSRYARDLVAEKGDDTPIEWVHRDERYAEKLATPDVTVADLIGDLDPIKAANLKLSFNDERVIHFGLIPRSNRCIFVINELPDLQPRIQVSLFNILQEGDIQIRGFKLRLPLDIQFVFTANPEDYTNRGSIVTPLKDRIQSQIITHYPNSVEEASRITQQEVRVPDGQDQITIPPLLEELVEQIAFAARNNDMVDQKSGVSARLTISAMELLRSAVEFRMISTGESSAVARVSDLFAVVPAITGKVELVYEGEQEGAKSVAFQLAGKAIRRSFPMYFSDPESFRRSTEDNPYLGVVSWFNEHEVEFHDDMTEEEYRQEIDKVGGLKGIIDKYVRPADDAQRYLFSELVLFGLAEYSKISSVHYDRGVTFSDLLNSVFSAGEEDDDESIF